MKVVAINSSPMMAKGNTARILGPFLDGMKGAGAEVELFYTKKLDINQCHGDFHCWVRHPGECFQDDDMAELLDRFRQADVWVLASPVFVDGITGPMKTLLDRMIPLIEPFVDLVDDRCRHPRREGTKSGKVVLVSNCGLWEKETFDPLLVHMEALCRNVDREFVGGLLRPHGPTMSVMREADMAVDDVIDAAALAGRELVETGSFQPATLARVSQELISRERFLGEMNRRFDNAINRWAHRQQSQS
jgi:multimeric flavodoxin WrbA